MQQWDPKPKTHRPGQQTAHKSKTSVLPSRGGSSLRKPRCLLLGLSTDWRRPTHTAENNFLLVCCWEALSRSTKYSREPASSRPHYGRENRDRHVWRMGTVKT